MVIVILLVIIAVAIFYYKKSAISKKSANGEYDTYVSSLINYYNILRDNYDFFGTVDPITIGSNIFAYNDQEGSLAGKSGMGGFLSVRVVNADNDFLAENLQVKIDIIEGKKYYQFIVKKDSDQVFNKQEKIAILNSVVEKLNGIYGQGTASLAKGVLRVIC